MKTASTINFNFQEAIRKAEELEEIAAGMKGIANGDMEDSFQQLARAWKGEAATVYFAKGEILKDRVLKSAKDLERAAATVRGVAKRTYDAEMLAYRLAKEREYNNH